MHKKERIKVAIELQGKVFHCAEQVNKLLLSSIKDDDKREFLYNHVVEQIRSAAMALDDLITVLEDK